MPIYFGENNIASFYVKNDVVLKVYQGAALKYTEPTTTTTSTTTAEPTTTTTSTTTTPSPTTLTISVSDGNIDNWTIINPVAGTTKYRVTNVSPAADETTFDIGINRTEFNFGQSNVRVAYYIGVDHTFRFLLDNPNSSTSGSAYIEALNSSDEVIGISATTGYTLVDNDDD